jgi:hypothetical protein
MVCAYVLWMKWGWKLQLIQNASFFTLYTNTNLYKLIRVSVYIMLFYNQIKPLRSSLATSFMLSSTIICAPSTLYKLTFTIVLIISLFNLTYFSTVEILANLYLYLYLIILSHINILSRHTSRPHQQYTSTYNYDIYLFRQVIHVSKLYQPLSGIYLSTSAYHTIQ